MGFKYEDREAYAMNGFVNSADASEPGVLQGLPMRHATMADQAYMGEGLDAFKSGKRDDDELVRFLPGAEQGPKRWGDKIGFFVNPSDKGKGVQLAARASRVVSYSANKNESLQYIKWFASPEVQKSGKRSAARRRTSRAAGSGYAKSSPFAQPFLDSMGMVVDFWAEPSYAQLSWPCKNAFTICGGDKGTAKEAVDDGVDWNKVFKDDGK